MKVVQINAVFGKGSTGKISFNIHTALKLQGEISYVFWGTDCLNDIDDNHVIRIGNRIDQKVHAILRRFDKKQGWHSKLATRMLCLKLKTIHPDVVHLHNLHSNYINLPILLRFLGENNISVLVTLHDCWFFTGFCMHYYRQKCDQWKEKCCNCPVVSRHVHKAVCDMFDTKGKLFAGIHYLAVNGVSEWTSLAAAESKILGNSNIIRTIYNWIDTDLFTPQLNKDEVFSKYNIPHGKNMILGVAQGWSEQKGLNEFIKIAEYFEDLVYIILVGKNLGVPRTQNLTCIGYTSNEEELRDLYSAADLFVNPSRMETFGLVTAEAMACGTPVVAYKNTGSAEIVTESCGMLVEDGNVAEMISAVKVMLENGKTMYSTECIGYTRKKFNKETQIDRYMELYKDIYQMKSRN
jgi:glycosyltransferase involved in cell wall biosynthesis